MSSKKAVSRRSERELAFQFLYGLDFAPVRSEEELRERFGRIFPVTDKAAGDFGFAWELALGVWGSVAELDSVISRFARNWRLDRIGRVELTLLRLAVYELLKCRDIPPRVAINEALELSRQFGDKGARSFINGVLDAVALDAERGGAAPPETAEGQK